MRDSHGQSILEAVVGSLILVPVVLLVADAACIIQVDRLNQQFAHNLARVAANQTTPKAADSSAALLVKKYRPSALVEVVSLVDLDFDSQSKIVRVETEMTMRLPVPFPGWSTVRLTAKSAQPIVAIPPRV